MLRESHLATVVCISWWGDIMWTMKLTSLLREKSLATIVYIH